MSMEFQKYIDKGFVVFPVKPDKSPDLKGKPTWKVDDSTEFKFDNDNIAIITGGKNNLVVLDIDAEDEEIKKEIEKVLEDYPTPVMRLGKRTRLPSRFYSYNGEISIKIENPATGKKEVEILSDGRYCVLPPTQRTDGYKFEWVKDSLLKFPKCDLLPPFNKEIIEKIENVYSKYAPISKDKKRLGVSPSDGTRCNHGSHEQLSAMLVAAIHAGDTPETIVKNLLEYDEKINPTISYFLCPERKEWRSKVKEVNAFRFVMEGFERNIKVGAINKVSLKEETRINLVKEMQLTKMKLPRLSGIAQEMFEHILANSSQERTNFAFPTAMMAVSTIIGNKIQFKGITPNLYTLVVGESGSGKTTCFNFIKDLLTSSPSGIPLLGASTITSTNGITQNLVKQRVQVGIIDEASSLFEKINDKAGSGEAISATLSELYTSTGRIFLGKNTSHALTDKNTKGNIGGCFSPYVNLLMGTTFDAFEKSFTSNLINRGFFGRGDIYFDYKSKKDKDRENRSIPEKFTQFLDMWRKVKNDSLWNPKADNLDLDENAHLRPFNIPEATLKVDAESLYKEIVDEIRNLKQKTEKDSLVIAMANRMEVMLVKYAIISTAFNNPDTTTLVISKKDLRFAFELVKANLNNANMLVSDKMFEGIRKTHMQKIFEFIKEKKEVTKHDIGKKFRYSMNKKQREEYLQELKESQIIKELSDKSTTIYCVY